MYMNKITLLLLALLLSIQSHAQVVSTTTVSIADATKILQTALLKQAYNNRGEMAPGDVAKEVYGYKRGFLDITLKNKIDIGTTSTSSEVLMSLQIDSKINQKTKIQTVNEAIQTTPIVNGVNGESNLIRTIDTYFKGDLLESYLDTTVGEEKVYRVWKRNLIKEYFDQLFTIKGLPITLRNTILKKMVAKKYLKLDKNDLQKGVLVTLGLKQDPATALMNKDITSKESTSVDKDFTKFLKVKNYLGIVNDKDDEISFVKNVKKVTTTLTPVHNMVLSVDYEALALEAIKNNKIKTYSFGFLDDTGLTDEQVKDSFKKIFTNLEILIWIDTKTFAIKSFRVEPYEIYLNIGENILLTSTVTVNYRENPTSATGYINPIPKTFITTKELRNMFLKY